MSRAFRPCACVVVAASLAVPAASAQVKNWPSESAPRALSARPVKFPPYEIRTLPNGLQVVVVEQHEQPSISVRMLVGAGSAQDVAPRHGVANMVASLLDQGTTTRTAQQIADAVDTIGGEVMAGAGTEVTFAYVTVLKDSFAQSLDLLSDIVRAPAFAPEELERQRDQLRSALKVSYQDPDYLASVVFGRLVYGFHPYGYPGTGTPASIERITRADLVAFHQQYFGPNNCILAVVGDMVPADAFAAVEKTFGPWERREVPTVMMLQPPPPTRRIVVIDVPDAVQTEIRAGHLGVKRNTDDFVAVDMAVRILGGEGANRLQRVLRMQRGLTYGASADLEAYRVTGAIAAETDTRSEATGEALRVMVDEFFRLQRESVRARELDDAKAYLAGSFPLSIETPDAIAMRVLTALFYGLPLKELETFRERVTAITPDDIERVTRAYFKPDRLSIVLVGNAAAFLVQLQRVGFRNIDVVSLADLDLTTADLRRPLAFRGGLWTSIPMPTVTSGVTAEEWAKAKDVVSRAIAACGGLEALRQVRTIRATAETVMATPEGPLLATTRTFIEYPGRFRVDATLPRGEVVQTYVDGTAWVKDPTGIRDAPTPMRNEFAQSIRRDWVALLQAGISDKLLGKRLPDERGLGGRPLHVVELWGEGLSPVRLAIDAETARIAWLSHQATGPGGRATVTESFDDFRPVKGVQFPYTAVVRRDAALVLERRLTDVQVNVTFPPAFFQKIQ
jgi:zinc protease